MKTKYQPIIILSICGMFLFFKYIAQLFPSLISTDLIEHYQMNGVNIGILASSYYYSYTLMQIVSGIMLDKYSLRFPAFLAILTITIGLYLFPNTDSFWSMCLCRILMGAGCSFATTLYMKAASIWTTTKTFCFISSLLGTATMVGAAVGSAPIAALFHSVGWHHGLRYISYAGFALAILALLFLKQKNEQTLLKTPSYQDIKKVMFDKNNLWLLLYSGVTFSPIVVLGGLWGIPFLELKFCTTTSDVAKLISMMFLGLAVGAPIWALFSSLINNKKHIMILANTIAFFNLSMLLFASISYGYAEVLFFIFGFCIGAFMLSFDICRQNNNLAVMGFAVAFINTGEGLVSSLLEPGIGFVLDRLKDANAAHFSLENYQLGLSVLPLCFILSTYIIYQLAFKEQALQWKSLFKLKLS